MVKNDAIKIFQVHPPGTTNVYKQFLGKTGKLLYKYVLISQIITIHLYDNSKEKIKRP